MSASPSSPFELLLDIATRARSGGEEAQARLRIQPHWSGVGFSLLGQRLVAPMGEVTEILKLPELTRLPRVQPWVRGVANIRGRLLPIVCLAGFFGGRPSLNWRSHRALVVEHGDIYCALQVDEVHGLKHFGAEAFREEARPESAALATVTRGAYAAGDGDWSIFRPELLLNDSRFLDAAL